MFFRIACFVCLAFLTPQLILAADQDYQVKPLDEQPPKTVSEAIRGALKENGLRVVQPDGSPLYDLWFAKAADAKPGFKPSSTVKYPFPAGGLVGVVRVPEEGGHDFRDQAIRGGAYTLRYAQQPVDGNHLGTSQYQDFLAMIPAESDEKPAPLSVFDLEELSKESAEAGTHPGILSLQPPAAKPSASAEVKKRGDYWVVSTPLQGKAGDESVEIRLDVVVVGHTVE